MVTHPSAPDPRAEPVETKSFSGNMWPQIAAIFSKQQPIERSSMNSWDDKNLVGEDYEHVIRHSGYPGRRTM